MLSLDAAATPFVTGYCAACAMQVLTWLDLDTTDQEHRRCLQCDTVVGAALQPAGLSALEAQGYKVRDPAAKRPGCGCAAGGCGRRQVLD